MATGRRRRWRIAVAAYPELLLVLAAAAIGLLVGRPLRWLDGHQGINVLLVVLVFATAVTVSTAQIGRLTASWRQIVAGLAVGAAVLPPLSWLASRIVSAGSLRNGIMAVGLAPCEIASVATTALAGGDPALAAVILIGSTALSVGLAGPVLSLEAGHAHVHSLHILVNLALVVALPLAAGLAVRAVARDDAAERSGGGQVRHRRAGRAGGAGGGPGAPGDGLSSACWPRSSSSSPSPRLSAPPWAAPPRPSRRCRCC